MISQQVVLQGVPSDDEMHPLNSVSSDDWTESELVFRTARQFSSFSVANRSLGISIAVIDEGSGLFARYRQQRTGSNRFAAFRVWYKVDTFFFLIAVPWKNKKIQHR